MSKIVPSFDQAVADIPDGAILMIDGFAGPGGTPQNLIRALRDHGASDLTIISNTAGLASVIGFGTIPGDRPIDIGILVENEQVKKVIASFPVSPVAIQAHRFRDRLPRGQDRPRSSATGHPLPNASGPAALAYPPSTPQPE